MTKPVCLLLFTFLTACGSDHSKHTVAGPSVQPEESSGSEVIARMDLSRFPLHAIEIKEVTPPPDPMREMSNQSSCVKAGGVWLELYRFGVLLSTTPTPSPGWDWKKTGRYTCESKRKWYEELPDAGKSCTKQADCVGNCVSFRTENGKLAPPLCQKYADQCFGVVYDEGHTTPFGCPVP
jgi:hypothetical protein